MNNSTSPTPQLLLASSSRYRHALLQRLGLAFDSCSPEIDESRQNDETIPNCAARLAREKADAVQQQFPDAYIIASDQICSLHGAALGKPGTLNRAVEQLQQLSGQEAHFYTAVCLSHGAQTWQAMDRTVVRFRPLSEAEIHRYLAREPALDCAGSFMSEQLGISLCASIENQDPSALIGLPLIATARLLREAGFRLP